MYHFLNHTEGVISMYKLLLCVVIVALLNIHSGNAAPSIIKSNVQKSLKIIFSVQANVEQAFRLLKNNT